jgi:NAD(P)-dependent dehydrogenase (short-subunit alcohol dehydrogenase family)
MALARAGAKVAFAARRRDRLEEAAREAGGGALAIACDVVDDASVKAAVDEAAAAFGGLDALVYAPGIGIFERLADIDGPEWRRLLDTNLVGPSLAIRAAIPYLTEARGKVVLISSIVIDDRPPRPQNAPYVVSKVALETLAQAWQGEHRAVGFTTIAMGDTVTEFGQDGDLARLGPMVGEWVAGGYMYGRAMQPEAVAEQVVSALRSAETIRRIAITPRYSDDPADGGGHW